MDLREGEHPDDESLEKFLLGSLGQHEAKHIEEHLLLCQVCIENACKLEDYIQAMKKSLGTGPTKAKAARKGKPG